jgi:putative drug exporter of the RND superfamily
MRPATTEEEVRVKNVTERLARASTRRKWLVISGWMLAVLASAAAIAGLLGTALTTDDDFTGRPEAQRAEQVLKRAFPPVRGDRGFRVDEAVIVSSPRTTAEDPRFDRRMSSLAAELRAAGAAEVRAGPVSHDRHSALLLVELGGDVEPVVERVVAANGQDGFRALIVGEDSIDEDFSRAADEDLARGELFGLALALIVLVAVFGGVAAAVVPIAVAIASIVVALAVVAGIGQAFVLNFVVVNVLVMMGLAVGIDYSLFVVSRFREERRAGRALDDAVAVAGATASRAVLFSGATVVLALVGMFLVPQTVFRSIAVGAIAVVLVSVLAALTLLPAALAVLGDRIERLRVPLLGRRAGGGLWSRVAGVALRRPAASLAAGVAVLVVLAVPYAGIETGTAGVGTLPESFQTRTAYEAIEHAFGPQGTAAAEVVVQGERTPELGAAIAGLRETLAHDPDYGETSVDVAPEAGVTRITVPVDVDATGPEAMAAVKELRERYVPRAFAGLHVETLVGGQSADELDFAVIARDRQPIVFAFVLGFSFLVLVAAFRSIAIPLTAIATNLLSVGAAYGLLVLVFQEGVGADLLGFQRADTVESWLPLLLFTILFGLSMDYHVFLLSRIRERWLATGDTRESIAFGVGTTARLITGAALIMVAVFAGFAGGQLVMFQQMGFGLGAAVLIDATLVRSVIVPSAMALLGRWNWWLPGRPRRGAMLEPGVDAA